ncbi:N-acetyltransferase family protein [Nonomuraea sp. CA-141351]|uniref:GNAT family N-acetyltransferase n=1 Tax=Nonomuraea sp. CA-141351 TaxID=3239996 RepID=UPI003D8E7E81
MNVDQALIRIRPARDEDREAVLTLAPRLAEGVAAWRDHQAAIRAGQRWLTDSLAGRHGAVFVAVEGDDSRVIGVVSVSRQRHFTGATDAYVGELAVAEHAVRGGVGRRLMAAAEDWARQQGLSHLTLETGAANTTARRFYASLGYLEEGVRLTRSLAEPS